MTACTRYGPTHEVFPTVNVPSPADKWMHINIHGTSRSVYIEQIGELNEYI